MSAFLKRRWFSLILLCWLVVFSFVKRAEVGYLHLPQLWGAGMIQGTWTVGHARIRTDGPPQSYDDDEGFNFEQMDWSAEPMFGLLWPPLGKYHYEGQDYVVVQHWFALALVIVWIGFAEFRHRKRRNRPKGLVV